MWSRLVDLASPIAAELQRRSAAAMADPSTHAAVLWLLHLEWWQATLLVLAICAAAIGTKVSHHRGESAMRCDADRAPDQRSRSQACITNFLLIPFAPCCLSCPLCRSA